MTELEKEMWQIICQKSTAEELAEQKAGYIYFIYNHRNGYMKIGRIKNIQTRFQSLNSGTADELSLIYYEYVKECKLMEKKLHQEYQKYKIKGEWFDYKKYMIDNIQKFTPATQLNINRVTDEGNL